jgi:hypothetical protein
MRLDRGEPMRLTVVDDRHLSLRGRGEFAQPRKGVGRRLSAAA